MDTVWPSGNISFILVQHAWGQFQSRPVWNCSSLMAKTSGLKLGITKNIKLITYRQIDHTADPSRIKDFLYLIICMDAYIICTLSSGKANQRANQTKNNEVAHTGKKTKHVFLYIKKKEINNMKKKTEKQTQKQGKTNRGRRTEEKLTADIWFLMEESWANQSGRQGLRSLTLVQRSRQCVYAAAVCVRGQRLLSGHGRNVIGRRGLRGGTRHHIWQREIHKTHWVQQPSSPTLIK